ncbi:MAG: papain-like cysteine protease family protein [Candidatus Bathyarchaeum tardum]|nr:MAG: papain-like cysteine protease family protein [Candidatus Bathyarchaeum tardum]
MHLSVPLVEPLQEDGFSCIPRCVKMVLMFIKNFYPQGRVPDFDLEEIGKIIDTRADGTYPNMILNLNSVPEVLAAIPSIEFEYALKWHTLTELETEIGDGQPPIVMIDLKDDQHRCKHAVVITEVNESTNQVYFNDPIYGERSMYIPDFLASWDSWDREVVKIKIGKKKQRMLEEFGNQEK